MEFKFFDKPHSHDQAFYDTRRVSDHIHEMGHRGRLLETVELVSDLLENEIGEQGDLDSIADWGCGNGGLLHELNKRFPEVEMWGYDLSPLAVQFGKEKYGVNISQLDITSGLPKIAKIVVLTETLEHLVDPHRLLRRMEFGAFVVASVPAFETPENHYEYHLRSWTEDSFAHLFSRNGWDVRKHYVRAEFGTQFLVAERR